MKDETPDTLKLPSFEEKVLVQLESVNGRLASLEGRLASLEKREEARDYDTKPVWNRVLTEILELRTEVLELSKYMRSFDRKLDVMNKDLLQVRSDLYGREMR